MLFTDLTFVAFSTSVILSTAAPFKIQDGQLQRHRRRAVDYPLESSTPPPSAPKFRKRTLPYSVVQVDGGSSSNAFTPPQASTITVTDPGTSLLPTTETILATSTITSPITDQTVVVTTTQEVSDSTTSVTPEVVTTVESASSDTPSSPTMTSVTIMVPNSATASGIPTQTTEVTDTVLNTIMDTIVYKPTPSPTAYYDDGMWHTYYPIKTFVPPGAVSSSSTINARAAAAQSTSNISRRDQHIASNSTYVSEYRCRKREASWEALEGWSDNNRESKRATPIPGAHTAVETKRFRTVRSNEAHYVSDGYTNSRKEARKAPAGLKLASYNVTRTEMAGAQRFRN